MDFISYMFRPVSYLGIDTVRNYKTWFDWIIPIVLSVFFVTTCSFLAPTLNIFNSMGVIDKFLSFVQNLPGFYIAALAAIATFGSHTMDEHIQPAVYVSRRNREGNKERMPLTRRRFLCFLFSFLTLESFFIVFISIVIVLFDVTSLLNDAAALALFFFYMFFVFQFLIVTFVGIYYLGDKIHEV